MMPPTAYFPMRAGFFAAFPACLDAVPCLGCVAGGASPEGLDTLLLLGAGACAADADASTKPGDAISSVCAFTCTCSFL